MTFRAGDQIRAIADDSEGCWKTGDVFIVDGDGRICGDRDPNLSWNRDEFVFVTEPEPIVGELALFDSPTLRDQLAMAALEPGRYVTPAETARKAYAIADAMMEARNA